MMIVAIAHTTSRHTTSTTTTGTITAVILRASGTLVAVSMVDFMVTVVVAMVTVVNFGIETTVCIVITIMVHV